MGLSGADKVLRMTQIPFILVRGRSSSRERKQSKSLQAIATGYHGGVFHMEVHPRRSVLCTWAVKLHKIVRGVMYQKRLEKVASDAQMASAKVETAQHSNARSSSSKSLLNWYWTRHRQEEEERRRRPRRRPRQPGIAQHVYDDDGGPKARTGTTPEDEGATEILQRSTRQISRLGSACYRSSEGGKDDGDEDDDGGGDGELSPLLLVVGVKSAVGHFDRRQAIRDTWMSVDLGPSFTERVCLQFITGSPRGELPVETASALQLEAYIYGDLLLGVLRLLV